MVVLVGSVVWFGGWLSCSHVALVPDLLLQQVVLGVDVDLVQVAAGSGDLLATRRWFDFLESRSFSLLRNISGLSFEILQDDVPRKERREETRAE